MRIQPGSQSHCQKRERCRQCFLYAEHQKQKYRILSPLVFPAAIGIMYAFYKPITMFLDKALAFTDRFASKVSFLPKATNMPPNPWANLDATAVVVQWIMLICLGLVLVTYMLRLLEYCIFKWQI